MEKVAITKACEIKVREIEWLWYPCIPFGKITMAQREAGDGKSTFALNLAANEVQRQFCPIIEIVREQWCATQGNIIVESNGKKIFVVIPLGLVLKINVAQRGRVM